MAGFWSNLLGRRDGIPIAAMTPNVTYVGADGVLDELSLESIRGMSVPRLWRTQPHLRTVVSFRARNIAHLGLHCFVRDGDDRQRDRSTPLALLFARPNPDQTMFELLFSLIGDLDLYDRAYWLVTEDAESASGWMLRRLPPSWVSVSKRTAFSVTEFVVASMDGSESVTVPASRILAFGGYHPTNPLAVSPTVETLRETLAEQVEAAKYRSQVWKRGGRVSAVLQRPKDAPQWSDGAREAFREDWYAKYTGNGPKAGGTPILEDGMTLERIDFNAQEQQFVEAAKLALSTVASAYHINPTMVGVLDNANYSNVREFRRMLYGDSLGPTLAQVEDRINAFLLPMIDADPARQFVEFNIAEKLQGSFEEQAQVMSTLVGRPIMTADEGRAKFNLAALGGDAEHLVTPLNVLIGGQASPRDGQTAGGGGGSLPLGDEIKKLVDAAAALIRSGFDPAGALEAVGLDPIAHLGLLPVTVQRPQEPENVDQEAVDALKAARALRKADSRARFKATDLIPESYPAKVEQVLRAFFERQSRVVLTALGAKATGDWWDQARWDKELADDLYALAATVSKEMGERQAEALGFSADKYNVDQTLAFLRKVAESRAGMVNSTTRDRLAKAIQAGSDPAAVFEEAKSARALSGGAALMSALAGFSLTEAAKQTTGDRAVKTWVVTSTNPRSEHAAMDGETVGIDETFSNGANWPGDPVLGADGVAGCQCSVDIEIP